MTKVLMVASEAMPFCKTGGLADVIGALPVALEQRGEQVAVVLPAYRINNYPGPLREAYRNLWIPLGDGFNVDIFERVERGVTFYFVNYPPLYDRDGIYASASDGWGYPDNHLRYATLSMAATGIIRHLFRPDVVHCHDWPSALTPVYLRHNFRNDPTFYGIKLLFTIHNLGYQGEFGPDVLGQIAVDSRLLNPGQLEFHGRANLMKGGVYFSDAVSTVSKGYAREIQTPEYGFGLDGFLRTQDRLSGILNGVDYSEWNPESDPYIAKNYSAANLAGKRECKRALLKELELNDDKLDRPVIGMVSRFAAQKGFDLVAEIMEALLAEDVTFVVLGSGDLHYENMFRVIESTHRDRMAVSIGYSEALSHRIEAGADMFLMPSRYEPSGLSQMYSLKYGTVPVVRATGGLDDTIEEGTGFKFQDYSGAALLSTVLDALEAYQDRSQWTAMMRRGMQKDFSWKASAAEYSALYRRILAA
jgi:starch synthase